MARLGVVLEGKVYDVNAAMPEVPADLREALLLGIDLHSCHSKLLGMVSGLSSVPLAELAHAPLIPQPGKIICLGLNYYDHAKESGREKPEYPWFFLRAASSLVAHGQPAIRPVVSERFDYEAELAVVIGKRAHHVREADALDVVFGYAPFNDISVRDYQKRTPQWTIGKNFDRTGAFGPCLVTADELPAGASGLRIQCRLNGTVMQDANTSDMIWGVAETIALLTECLTLDPGDVIVMGTPSGVGQARNPPVWMKNGDKVDVEIDRLGVLSNFIVDEVR